MHDAIVLWILGVRWVLPVACGCCMNLASSSIFTRAASARTAVVFIWLHKTVASYTFRSDTYMTGCLLDVVVMMVVHLLESTPRLLLAFLSALIHLTRFPRFP